jgi:acyl-CoA synthetase (AMP-forming)/AMP-acid ligase II
MRTVPAGLAKRYEAEGWRTQDTIGDLLARGLEAAPNAEFRVHSAARPWSGTFADVDHLARRLAAGFHDRKVGPGDVVAFQLPNWVEAAAVFWAASFLGAVVVPIVHFYGRKELGYILTAVKPKVFVAAATFGRLEYQKDLVEDAQVPVVGVVGRNFDDLLADEPMQGVIPTAPTNPALIAFTSGTTRDPKGVIHSHRTLGFETRQLAGLYPPDRGRQLTAAPVGHFIGMVNAFLIPVLELMKEQGLSVGGGATYYVTSLLDHPDFNQDHLKNMKYAGLGGAPVPAAVTERLHASGITAFRSYGSTEQPSITGSMYNAPKHKRLYTDGAPLTGVEVRLTDTGEIESRRRSCTRQATSPAPRAARSRSSASART